MTDETISARAAGPQVRAVSPSQWTRAKRAKFLDHLAVTCNVAASARAVGMSTPGVYLLRRRDPAFADLWLAALRTGYDRLEERLLQQAGAGINDVPIGDTEVEEPPLNVELALDLLTRHRVNVEGGRRPMYGKVHRMPREEAEKKLSARLDAPTKRLEAQQHGGAARKRENSGAA